MDIFIKEKSIRQVNRVIGDGINNVIVTYLDPVPFKDIESVEIFDKVRNEFIAPYTHYYTSVDSLSRRTIRANLLIDFGSSQPVSLSTDKRNNIIKRIKSKFFNRRVIKHIPAINSLLLSITYKEGVLR